jgi:hypothetical protein
MAEVAKVKTLEAYVDELRSKLKGAEIPYQNGTPFNTEAFLVRMSLVSESEEPTSKNRYYAITDVEGKHFRLYVNPNISKITSNAIIMDKGIYIRTFEADYYLFPVKE